jgi:hypothetical protein
MGVKLKDRQPVPDGSDQSVEITSSIAEMGAFDIGKDIPIPQEKLDRIKSRDNDPKFVVVEIEETDLARGTSKAEWPGSVIRSIVEQVNKNKPVGYQGHIPENEDSTAFPPVQAVWLGAVEKNLGSKMVARIKGYLMPNSSMRDYVDLEAVDGVSVRGIATMVRKKEGGLRVKEFILKSIDFARKGESGMPTRIVAVTSEMKSKGGTSVEPKDIAAIDESDLRHYNELLVERIERKATQEIQVKVSEMEGQLANLEDFRAKVTEQEGTIAAMTPKATAFDEICGKLGVGEGENPVDSIVKLMDQVEGAAREHLKTMIDRAVEKIAGKSERAQKLVKRLVGEQIEDAFKGRDLNDKKLYEEIEVKVSEMVEEDEDVKAIVSEMWSDSTGGGKHLGGKSHETEPDDRRSRTGGVKFGKAKVS